MAQLVFDPSGESQAFMIGEDRIYFFRDIARRTSPIAVAQTTGEPWSPSTDYLTFATEAEAERFLCAAQRAQGLPHDWH